MDNTNNPEQNRIRFTYDDDGQVEPQPLNFAVGATLDRKYFKRYLNRSLGNLAWSLQKIMVVKDNFVAELYKNSLADMPIRQDYSTIVEGLSLIEESINQIAELIIQVNGMI